MLTLHEFIVNAVNFQFIKTYQIANEELTFL